MVCFLTTITIGPLLRRGSIPTMCLTSGKMRKDICYQAHQGKKDQDFSPEVKGLETVGRREQIRDPKWLFREENYKTFLVSKATTSQIYARAREPFPPQSRWLYAHTSPEKTLKPPLSQKTYLAGKKKNLTTFKMEGYFKYSWFPREILTETAMLS